jgi:hypothetical protein
MNQISSRNNRKRDIRQQPRVPLLATAPVFLGGGKVGGSRIFFDGGTPRTSLPPIYSWFQHYTPEIPGAGTGPQWIRNRGREVGVTDLSLQITFVLPFKYRPSDPVENPMTSSVMGMPLIVTSTG